MAEITATARIIQCLRTKFFWTISVKSSDSYLLVNKGIRLVKCVFYFFPLLGSMSLSANDAALTYATVGGSTLGRLFDARSFQYPIGSSAAWSLFNYGRTKKQVRVEDAHFQAPIRVI